MIWFGDHDERKELDNVKKLKQMASEVEIEYMKSLLNPDKHVAKIPSVIPRLTATASIHNNFTITPNASGNFLLVIDPFQPNGLLYQSANVDGLGNGTVTNLAVPQDANIVDMFRLVSAGITLRYFGSLTNLSGYFVAGLTSNVAGANATDFLTFNNVENLTNKKVNLAIDGVKMVYTPGDEMSLDFQPNSVFSGNTHPCKWQYLFVVAGSGFPNSACIRLDYWRNIEYEAKPAYKEYIAHYKSDSSRFDNTTLNSCSNIGNADGKGVSQLPELGYETGLAPIPYNSTVRPQGSQRSWREDI